MLFFFARIKDDLTRYWYCWTIFPCSLPFKLVTLVAYFRGSFICGRRLSLGTCKALSNRKKCGMVFGFTLESYMIYIILKGGCRRFEVGYLEYSKILYKKLENPIYNSKLHDICSTSNLVHRKSQPVSLSFSIHYSNSVIRTKTENAFRI